MKKDFAGALRKTTTAQKTAIDARFANADSVFLGMKPDAAAPPALPVPAPEAPPTPVPAAASPPAESPVAETAPPKAAPAPEAVIRDTFSMPPGDHGLIEQLRVRAAREGRNTNKSEVVRAGLRALASLSAAQLVEHLEGLERVKPGRK